MSCSLRDSSSTNWHNEKTSPNCLHIVSFRCFDFACVSWPVEKSNNSSLFIEGTNVNATINRNTCVYKPQKFENVHVVDAKWIALLASATDVCDKVGPLLRPIVFQNLHQNHVQLVQVDLVDIVRDYVGRCFDDQRHNELLDVLALQLGQNLPTGLDKVLENLERIEFGFLALRILEYRIDSCPRLGVLFELCQHLLRHSLIHVFAIVECLYDKIEKVNVQFLVEIQQRLSSEHRQFATISVVPIHLGWTLREESRRRVHRIHGAARFSMSTNTNFKQQVVRYRLSAQTKNACANQLVILKFVTKGEWKEKKINELCNEMQQEKHTGNKKILKQK